MVSFQQYVAADAVAWADRVRQGEVSAAEVLDAAIARAQAVNPAVNAIAVELFDQARSIASGGVQSGPFAGVPFALKDLLQTLRGVPLTNGSRAFDDVGEVDTELVRRFKRAGLIMLCTSTTPELGTSATTESTRYGATRNPWNRNRTSGGSSGGSAALVAAGVLPMAHATDGGGSIRGPASCCGLFGMKPSRGRTPLALRRTEGWLGCSTSHAVTRSVRDSAALLDATHGFEPGSRYVAPDPRGTFLEATHSPPRRLRIALHWSTVSKVVPDAQCIRAAEEAGRLCEELGHEVDLAAPPLNLDALAIAFGCAVVASTATAAANRAHQLGVDSVADDLEETNRDFVHLARDITAVQLMQANEAFMAAAFTMAEFQKRYDVILTPTMGRLPVPIGTVQLMQPAPAYRDATAPFSCFTAIYNQTGQPAMTVPLAWSSDGLPIGVQFAGRVGDETLLFALAAQLERARPWFDRLPALP